ncbi:hypothetical protein ERJ75_001677800 [Trypanosoma vivax]|nr:hypothetical protein ERJ75_001677800 [Trypanosoma vivax]
MRARTPPSSDNHKHKKRGGGHACRQPLLCQTFARARAASTRPGGHARCSRSSRRGRATQQRLVGASPARCASCRSPAQRRSREARSQAHQQCSCMCARVSGSTVRQRLARPHRTTAHGGPHARRHDHRATARAQRPAKTPPAHRHTEACANRGAHYGHGRRTAECGSRGAGSVTTTNAGVKSELERALSAGVARAERAECDSEDSASRVHSRDTARRMPGQVNDRLDDTQVTRRRTRRHQDSLDRESERRARKWQWRGQHHGPHSTRRDTRRTG